MSVKTRSSFEDFLFSIFRDTGYRRDLEILQTSQQQNLSKHGVSNSFPKHDDPNVLQF